MSRPGRSVQAPLLAPVLALHLAAWFTLLVHGTSWVGGWTKAVEQVAGSVVIVGPLLGALTADLYARRARTSVPLLAPTSRHPVHAWYLPALRLWAVAAASLVALAGEAAVAVAVAGPPLELRPLAVLPLCGAALGAHTLIGTAVGLRLAPRLAGPVAGVASFVAFLLSVQHLAPAAFMTGGVSGDLVGEQHRLTVVAHLTLVAMVTMAAVALGTGWSRGWGRTRLVAAGTLLLVAVGLGNGLGPNTERRFEPARVALACRGEQPEVCVPASSPRALPAASRRMAQLVRPLVAAGVDVPERWTYFWGQRPAPDGGVLRMRAGAALGTRVRDDDLVASLATPALCRGFFTGPSASLERALDARTLVAQWIGSRNRLGHGAREAPDAWFASAESEVWVRTTYALLRRCDLDAVRLPR